jgi:hypothetical protein
VAAKIAENIANSPQAKAQNKQTEQKFGNP